MYADKDAIEAKFRELDEIDPDLVLELLHLYFDMIEGKKAQLLAALHENKFDIIHSISHSLKSTCGNLGSQILFTKLLELEKQTKNNIDLRSSKQVETLLYDALAEMDLFSVFIGEKKQQLTR
jgi:HPt (histidine-containing phosphotransfer) domain-containing protein